MLYDSDIIYSQTTQALVDKLCYLKDARKIRSYIHMQKGYAPSLKAIEKRLEEYNRLRNNEYADKGVGHATKDWACSHTREEHNHFFTSQGTIICRTCRMERQLRAELARDQVSRFPSKAMSQELSEEQQKIVVQRIAHAAETVFAVNLRQILSRGTEPAVLDARYAVYLVAREQGIGRYPIAQVFGRADVGTVTHGCDIASKNIAQNPSYKMLVDVVRRMTGQQVEYA